MRKNPLIGISFVIAWVIVFASYTNVVGVYTVALSNHSLLKDVINQKDFLFKIILDIMNNKDIQNIVQISEIKGELTNSILSPRINLLLITSRMDFNTALHPQLIITKNCLKYTYFIGFELSKNIGKSKVQSIFRQFQVNNQETQKEISANIVKNDMLNKEIEQLSELHCDCENDNTTYLWNFPVLCLLLIPFLIVALWLAFHTGSTLLGDIIVAIASILHCSWLH